MLPSEGTETTTAKKNNMEQLGDKSNILKSWCIVYYYVLFILLRCIMREHIKKMWKFDIFSLLFWWADICMDFEQCESVTAVTEETLKTKDNEKQDG